MAFQKDFGQFAFSCTTEGCPRVVLGFHSRNALTAHELRHSQRLRCFEPGCHYNDIGFANARALGNHVRKHHTTRKPVPKRLKITAELSEPQDPSQVSPPAGGGPKDIGLDFLSAEDPEPELKKLGQDWEVAFSPSIPRKLDVDLVHTLDHDSVVCCVAFSRNGGLLATGSNRSAKVFDSETGEELYSLSDDSFVSGSNMYCRSVSFSPDGTSLAVATKDKHIRIWDLRTRCIHRDLIGHEQNVNMVTFSEDGQMLASASDDRTVRLWDMKTGQEALSFMHTDSMSSVAISHNCRYVAAGSLDSKILLCDIDRCEVVELLEGHRDIVCSVVFSPTGRELISGSGDSSVKVWKLSRESAAGHFEVEKSHCMNTLVGHRVSTPSDRIHCTHANHFRRIPF